MGRFYSQDAEYRPPVMRKLWVLQYTSVFRKEHAQPSVVEDIVQRATQVNKTLAITGVLLYLPPDQIFQELEGPKEAVDALFQRIQADQRHTDIRLVKYERSHRRNQTTWLAMDVPYALVYNWKFSEKPPGRLFRPSEVWPLYRPPAASNDELHDPYSATVDGPYDHKSLAIQQRVQCASNVSCQPCEDTQIASEGLLWPRKREACRRDSIVSVDIDDGSDDYYV